MIGHMISSAQRDVRDAPLRVLEKLLLRGKRGTDVAGAALLPSSYLKKT